MSKAFTRESDETQGEEVLKPRPTIPPGSKRYITRQGADRLRHEAMVLLEKRSVLGRNLAANSDTAAAVRRMEAVIQRIEEVLATSIISDPPSDTEKAGFGAWIRLRDQNGEEETYQIVGPDEAEPDRGRISSNSPLAQALMNSRAGETVRFKSPAGEQELTILSVQY